MNHPEQMPDPSFIKHPINEVEIAKEVTQIDYREVLTRNELAERALNSIPLGEMDWLADLLAQEYETDQDENDRE